ncbi:MAG: 5'/3'-nucleotidase SurE [Acidimicrobiales bacterium]
MAAPLQIMVTNDDGIDSIGMHVLARSMLEFGEVTVVAPDSEFSGAGAAIGAIWEKTPEVHRSEIADIDTVWTVSGAPALCVLYARLGAFGFTPDLIVSGINPGANVGRSVYHSGTIGAALTGRNGGIPGIAISQSVTDFGVEGQAWGDVISSLRWETAARVAQLCVGAMIADPRAEAGVLNVNVPDVEFDELAGYEWTEVGVTPPRSMSDVT